MSRCEVGDRLPGSIAQAVPTVVFFLLNLLQLEDFQPLAAIATTPQGVYTLQPLCETGAVTLWVPDSLIAQISAPGCVIQPYQGSLRAHLEALWTNHRGFIFCLATGAVVRLIAPLLHHKSSDPAVVVVGAGQHVISLCSGHQGGADRLTQIVAHQLSATPVLSGGANGLQLPGIDRLGLPFGWRKGTGDWTGVSAAIARQQPTQIIQEVGTPLWQSGLPKEHPFQLIESDATLSASPAARIWISATQRSLSADAPFPEAQWHPRVLWVGVGCERGTPRKVIESAIAQVFVAHHLAEEAIAGIATLSLKADEPGLVDLCRDRQWPLRCFAAEHLRAVPVPTPSAVVDAEVGTPSVAEAAAILSAASSLSSPDQTVLQPEISSALRVPKQIFRLEGYSGAVTVAIAHAEREFTGLTGSLQLVGMGPGQLSQMTPAAQAAIAQADVIIGYSLYIDLISPLLQPGQIVEASPITQERQRAERAIELAQWGLTVAVVSSGDCGIYGMAGLVLEQLRADGWDGKIPSVQVFPGITALQAAASRVGAPLMHDFCAISLSDLLTPWTVIEQRLIAAAQADFVTALYNPRSQSRTQPVAIAQTIFLKYRHPDTPVAIVRSAYRPDEQITLTTLEQMLTCPIDMLTTVLIGNQSTRFYADWLITPRGYLGFDPDQIA